MLFAYWSGALCIAVAAAILSLVVLKLTRSGSLALVVVVPGLIYFPVALANQRYGSLWSYVNGTESAFSLVLFACLVAFIVRFRVYDSARARIYLPVGILVSGLVLARLDDVFIIPALCAPLLLRRLSLPAKFSRWVLLAGCPALIILMYCAFNLAYAGTPLPVSGQVKGGLGYHFNLTALRNVVLPVDELWGNDWQWWRALTWRALHNCIPVAASVGFLLAAYRRSRFSQRLSSNTLSLLSALSLYVVAKGAYNFMFVSFWNQGHWYYPVSICIANILVAVYLLRTKGILAFDFILRMALHHRIVRFISVAAVLAVSLLLLIYVAKFAVGHSASSVIGNYSLIRIAVMLGALGAATGLLLAAASILRSRITEVRDPVGFGISILLVLYVANAMMAEKADARYNQQYYRFWLRRKSTTSDIREQLITPPI